MTIKVLHIIGTAKIGGVELSVKQFLENSCQKDSDIQHFLCANFEDNSFITNLKICTLNIRTNTENPFVICFNAIKIARFVKSNKIDIIHSYNRNTTLTSLIVKKLLKNKIRTVSSISGMYNLSGIFRKFFNQWFLKTDCTIAPSKCAKDHFIRNYKIKNPDQIRVIYEGIDPKDLPNVPLNFEQKLNLSKDSFKIGMLARFSKIKGQQVLVEALHYLPKNFNYECFLIGPQKPNSEKYLNELIQKFNVNVKILHQEYSWVINLCDIIVCPSTREESFGRVAVEAGFLKKIAIVSSSGGHLEVVKDKITGFHTKQSSPKDLAEKILFVKNLPDNEKDIIKENAFNFVRAKFSIEKHVQQKLQLYKEIMNNN